MHSCKLILGSHLRALVLLVVYFATLTLESPNPNMRSRMDTKLHACMGFTVKLEAILLIPLFLSDFSIR